MLLKDKNKMESKIKKWKEVNYNQIERINLNQKAWEKNKVQIEQNGFEVIAIKEQFDITMKKEINKNLKFQWKRLKWWKESANKKEIHYCPLILIITE
jgi:hypothetical protein